MKRAKIFLIIGLVMFVAAILYVAYAINHPMLSLPISLEHTYLIYKGYAVIMILMFVAAIVFKIKKK